MVTMVIKMDSILGNLQVQGESGFLVIHISDLRLWLQAPLLGCGPLSTHVQQRAGCSCAYQSRISPFALSDPSAGVHTSLPRCHLSTRLGYYLLQRVLLTL